MSLRGNRDIHVRSKQGSFSKSRAEAKSDRLHQSCPTPHSHIPLALHTPHLNPCSGLSRYSRRGGWLSKKRRFRPPSFPKTDMAWERMTEGGSVWGGGRMGVKARTGDGGGGGGTEERTHTQGHDEQPRHRIIAVGRSYHRMTRSLTAPFPWIPPRSCPLDPHHLRLISSQIMPEPPSSP